MGWNPISGIEDTFNEVTSGASTAPTPKVGGSAPAAVPPTVWTAPNVGASGHFHVHRDHLTTAADVIRASLPELDAAINKVNSHTAAFNSLTTWPTGSSLAGNLVSAVEGFANAGQDTSGAHAGAAKGLADTAAAYEEAETNNVQAVGGIGASGPSAPAASSAPSAPAPQPSPAPAPQPAPAPTASPAPPSPSAPSGGKWS